MKPHRPIGCHIIISDGLFQQVIEYLWRLNMLSCYDWVSEKHIRNIFTLRIKSPTLIGWNECLSKSLVCRQLVFINPRHNLSPNVFQVTCSHLHPPWYQSQWLIAFHYISNAGTSITAHIHKVITALCLSKVSSYEYLYACTPADVNPNQLLFPPQFDAFHLFP